MKAEPEHRGGGDSSSNTAPATRRKRSGRRRRNPRRGRRAASGVSAEQPSAQQPEARAASGEDATAAPAPTDDGQLNAPADPPTDATTGQRHMETAEAHKTTLVETSKAPQDRAEEKDVQPSAGAGDLRETKSVEPSIAAEERAETQAVERSKTQEEDQKKEPAPRFKVAQERPETKPAETLRAERAGTMDPNQRSDAPEKTEKEPVQRSRGNGRLRPTQMYYQPPFLRGNSERGPFDATEKSRRTGDEGAAANAGTDSKDVELPAPLPQRSWGARPQTFKALPGDGASQRGRPLPGGRGRSGAQWSGGLHLRPLTFYSRKDIPRGQEREKARSPIQQRSVVAKAQEEPDSLTSQETTCLVRMVCAKALHEDGAAKTLAHFCLAVITKQQSGAFAKLLLESCREWFVRHDELLPRAVQGTGGASRVAAQSGPQYKWTSLITFLSELLAGLAGAGSRSTPADCSFLAVLLCECCEISLRCPARNCLDEIKCLRAALAVAGTAAESAAAEHVKNLLALMQRASKDAKFPPEAQKIILEVISSLNSPRKYKATRNTTYRRMRGKR